jgi:hypothetical protein
MNVLEDSAVALLLLLPRPWLNVKRGGDDESDELARAGPALCRRLVRLEAAAVLARGRARGRPS